MTYIIHNLIIIYTYIEYNLNIYIYIDIIMIYNDIILMFYDVLILFYIILILF